MALAACAVSRFIPARAGNTLRVLLMLLSGPVHPRAGGEHSNTNVDGDTITGSSPRGRGTHRGAGARIRQGRFIPARAGNTFAG